MQQQQRMKFYARGTGLVSVPDERRIVGLKPRYVGRTAVIVDGACAFPAAREPYECATPDEEARLGWITKNDASLWPADEATAHALGVPYVPLTWSDGSWIPTPAVQAKAKVREGA